LASTPTCPVLFRNRQHRSEGACLSFDQVKEVEAQSSTIDDSTLGEKLYLSLTRLLRGPYPFILKENIPKSYYVVVNAIIRAKTYTPDMELVSPDLSARSCAMNVHMDDDENTYRVHYQVMQKPHRAGIQQIEEPSPRQTRSRRASFRRLAQNRFTISKRKSRKTKHMSAGMPYCPMMCGTSP